MQDSNSFSDLQYQIESAVTIIKNCGVVAIPTDTLYGLAASAFEESAVEKIFKLKGRPNSMAIPLIIAEPNDINKWAINIPEITWDLTKHFWPGALTIILERNPKIPHYLGGDPNTIGFRVSNHLVPTSIARSLGVPITGTSANRSGGPNLETIKSMKTEFGDKIDMIVEKGEKPRGLSSTVIDLTKKCPRILRNGEIPKEALETVCNSKFS